MAGARRSSREPSNCRSVITSDSDSDMWSVASDDEEAFGPRLDAASLWQLLRKAHPSFRDQEEPRKLLTMAAEKLQANPGEEEAELQQRREQLGEHGQELLSWYAQRVSELERENKALRCELVVPGRGHQEVLSQPLPLPQFKSGRFDIAGSDDEQEEADEFEDAAQAEKQKHSLISLFDVDWQRVGAENAEAAAKSLGRRASGAATRLPSRDAEDSLEDTDPGEPDVEPEGELLNTSSTANHFIALERLLVSLSEADARLIWLQFARYESEIGYLRSVISSYEDICLRSGDATLGAIAGSVARGLSRRRVAELSRPRRHSHAEVTQEEPPLEEIKVPEAPESLAAPAKAAERARRRSAAAKLRSASTASGAGRRPNVRGSAHAILESAGLSLLERSGVVEWSGMVRRGRRLSRPGLEKMGTDSPTRLRELPKLQNIEAFLASPPKQGQRETAIPAMPAPKLFHAPEDAGRRTWMATPRVA